MAAEQMLAVSSIPIRMVDIICIPLYMISTGTCCMNYNIAQQCHTHLSISRIYVSLYLVFLSHPPNNNALSLSILVQEKSARGDGGVPLTPGEYHSPTDIYSVY